MEKEKKGLPQYWAVKNDSSQLFKDEVIKWLNQITKLSNYFDGSASLDYYGYDGNQSNSFEKGVFHSHDLNDFENNPVLLTLKQFIKLKAETQHEQLIGYRAPHDMFGGEIKKGELLVKYYFGNLHYIKQKTKLSERENLLPAEIVEQWEPVYKSAFETIILGSSKIEFTVYEDKIEVDNDTVDVKKLTSLFKLPIDKIGDNKSHKIELIDATYKIGCSTFTMEELKKLLEVYNRLNQHG
jgi:hypothetical protein